MCFIISLWIEDENVWIFVIYIVNNNGCVQISNYDSCNRIHSLVHLFNRISERLSYASAKSKIKLCKPVLYF